MKILILFGIVCTILLTDFCFTDAHKGQQRGWQVLTEAPPVAREAAGLRSVAFFNEQVGFAISSLETLRTNDGGVNWLPVEELADIRPRNLLVARSFVWLLGSRRDKPVVIRIGSPGNSSDDYTPIDIGAGKGMPPSLNAIDDMCFSTDGNVWVVGGFGLAEFHTKDTSWDLETLHDDPGQLTAVQCAESNTIWAVGPSGGGYFDGKVWRPISVFSGNNLVRIVSIRSNLWAVGGDDRNVGVVFHSEDGGKRWTKAEVPSCRFYFDIQFENRRGWLLGSDGRLMSTSDGGISWATYDLPVSVDLHRIFRLREQLWIVGGRATVLGYVSASLTLPPRNSPW